MRINPHAEAARLRQELYGCECIYGNFSTEGYQLDLQGWGSQDPGFAEVIEQVRPSRILEMGTWKGASAIHMANLAPWSHVTCVDTWLGAEEFMHPPGDVERNLMRCNGQPMVYRQFLANVILSGLKGRITPIVQTSAIACRWMHARNFKFDLIYIDGSHAYADVVQDIGMAGLLLSESGVIMGDDYGVWEGVTLAVSERNHKLVGENKWILA